MKINKEHLLVLSSPLFLLFQECVLSYLFLLAWCLVAVYSYLRNDKKVVYTLLLINTYHVFGYSIYKNNFLFISIVYSIILFLLIVELKKIKKIPALVIAFAVFFPIRMVLGLFYMFEIKYFIIESILFFSFFFFLVLFYNKSNSDKNDFLNVLKNYILLYFPYLTLISLTKGEMINLRPFFLDEFGHFYLISIFPIIIYEVKSSKKRMFLLIFHLVFIVIRFKFLYISSFAFIGAGISIMLMIFFNFYKIYKYVTIFVLFSVISLQIISNSNVSFGKHKVDQLTETLGDFFNLKSIEDIKKIPNSPKTRVLEVMNINSNLIDSGILTTFLGRGFGSYFIDDKYPFKSFNVRVDSSAYSEYEVDAKKYLRPHNTIPYVFLKMGYFGLLFLCFLTIFTLFKLSKNDWLLYVYPPYLVILFGAGLKNFMMLGILTGIVLSYNQIKELKDD